MLFSSFNFSSIFSNLMNSDQDMAGGEPVFDRLDADIAKATEILQSQNQYWALTRHEAQLTP